jgi:hypothetical protein
MIQQNTDAASKHLISDQKDALNYVNDNSIGRGHPKVVDIKQ